MEDLYENIFTRRSIRKYDLGNPLTEEELQRVLQWAQSSSKLIEDIQTLFILTPKKLDNVRFGQCSILAYSQKKENYLVNMGYQMEQVDLLCAQNHIGSCWYGLSRPTMRAPKGFSYTIQMALGRPLDDYRRGIEDFKRKSLDDIWDGDFDKDVKEAVRLSPSACNSQSHRIISRDNTISVYRTTDYKALLPKTVKSYFNSLDVGISLCHLELALSKKGYGFTRTIFAPADQDPILIARYSLK